MFNSYVKLPEGIRFEMYHDEICGSLAADRLGLRFHFHADTVQAACLSQVVFCHHE